MNKLSFYEQAGIVVPGSVLLFGLFLIEPDVRVVFTKDGVTVGGLGIFVLLAYAAGHLIAALANVLEVGLWYPFGGMPSNWVVNPKRSFLTDEQTAQLEARLSSRLRLGSLKVRGMDRRSWNKVFQQLYRDVLVNRPGRVEIFNGNYGLNRGLASATVILAVVLALFEPAYWLWSIALLAAAMVYLYRAYRFGVHFAREVLTGFLLLSSELPADTVSS